MPYAILRIRKVKSAKDMTLAEQHNDRTRDTPNADAARAHLNQTVVGGRDHTLMADVNQRIQEGCPGQKIRSNAVLGIDVLMTASPEYFRPDGSSPSAYDKEKTKLFVQHSVAWLQKRFGKDNVVRVELHLDESTPHLHAMVVPLDGRGKLNARAVIGGSKNVLRDMQTEFADALKPLGLERGLGGSKATHQEVGKFYDAAKGPVEPLPVVKSFAARQVVPQQNSLIKAVWSDKTLADSDIAVVSAKTYRTLETKAAKWQKQANTAQLKTKEARELKHANAQLAAQLAQTKRTLTEMEKQELARLRPLPLREVLKDLYDARMAEPGVYHLANGKKVAIDKATGAARVDGGRVHKSAVDMVRDIEGFSADAGGALQAAAKLAEVFPPDKIACDTLNSQALQHSLVQRVQAAEAVAKKSGVHRSLRRGRAGIEHDRPVGGNWVNTGRNLHEDTLRQL